MKKALLSNFPVLPYTMLYVKARVRIDSPTSGSFFHVATSKDVLSGLLIFFFTFLSMPYTLQAQVKIGDNLTSVNANSILELESTTKALLLPRITQTQINAMQNVPAGMLVYNSTTNLLNIRTNSGWTTLALAANAASATNPWLTSGNTIYSTTGKVGIGTSSPSMQLANNSGNPTDFQGVGGNSNDSFSWASSGAISSYVGQIYNSGTGTNNNGLLVKVNSTDATAFAVYQDNLSLLTVKGDRKVGINKASPTGTLDVNGNIVANRFDIGVQYVYLDYDVNYTGEGAQVRSVSCPYGQLIGGGGGHRTFNDEASQNIIIHSSGPDPDSANDTWRVIFTHNGAARGVRTIRLYAVCANVK